ncbi:phosphatase PAP2 family protein [Nocardia sp. NPDC049526]|uniref:phosphatase PAP2 family protein n=1 Tax=Nocardia sp. NPDC049526 TaxID=3364316 RepID=UPI0037BA78C1
MSAVLDLVDQIVGEVASEAATAEIAAWIGAVSFAVIVASLLADRFRPAESLARTTGRRAVRAAAVFAMFVELGVQVRSSGWLTGMDAATLDWFTTHRSSGMTTITRAVTTAGNPAGLAVIGLLLAAVLARRLRSMAPMVLILGIVAVASAASTISKVVIGRNRPPTAVQLMTETDFSYPSGHVTGTAALAGAALLVYLGSRPTSSRGIVAVVSTVVVVAVVAVTRLYLGVHWLTDVIGGGLLGCSVVLIGAIVRPYLQSALRRRPADTPSKGGLGTIEHDTPMNRMCPPSTASREAEHNEPNPAIR